ncbi:pyridoxal phosphate-dependent aminotransferase [Acidaminococcus fermentans]|uniref:pyridoxal phosphate-dependent aminotransferase n=1 Tax=Acidaminococcus fermentans TaxID=905 RepID=UPI002E78998B|nr:pyridoxal phosphate-dependent aminotransferase [Acidaminococcus fermentans]MEE1598813.1 pyridoxal phosphate-dependent aminotransferase [Acidaminococcus fermentans]MEE4123075.1 pyridoxal phosphate-dependent aminotransferase [Acidaminococcus fermentans]
MHISQRTLHIPTSPIRKLAPIANRVEKTKKIYHLNIGQPDIPTPESFFEGVASYHPKVVAYGKSQGDAKLLKAIQGYYESWDMDYALDDIFVTNGGSEAISFAIMTTCDPGDNVLMFEPFYANYKSFTGAYNVEINGVPTSPDTGYHLPDQETVEKYINDKTRAILISNPGNPTGVIYTREEMDMLSRITRKYDLALIADEVYREFVYDGQYTSFGRLRELDDNLVLIDSVSKRYSACGARSGCVITRNKALQQELLKCCQARLSCPEIVQLGAAALYTTPKSYWEDVKKEYTKRRDTIKGFLAQMPGVIASDPKGAFYVMVKMPIDDTEKFAKWLLEDFDIDGETVMITPGNGFYASDVTRGQDEARLAYVLNVKDLEKAMHILAEGLKQYPGRK